MNFYYCSLLIGGASMFPRTTHAFTLHNSVIKGTVRSSSSSVNPLHAAPKRLEENVEGVVYVNDKCINCAACSNFAPSVFRRADDAYAHIVHHQPATVEEILDARAAMSACPVAAIRSETMAQRRHLMTSENDKKAVEESWSEHDANLVKQMALSPKVNGLELPFPRPLLYHDVTTTDQNDNHNNLQNVYNVGHHNEASFGATPYLLEAKVGGQNVWIMVDTPKFSKAAVDAVTSITGPDGPHYLVLSHVDDTADHDQWASQFSGNLQRIFHSGDTGKHNWRRDKALDTDIEILLPVPTTTPATGEALYAYGMDGSPLSQGDWHEQFLQDPDNDVVIVHTPGHSPGSITLWKKPTPQQPGMIFTGDHYAYSAVTQRMSGFPRYGNNLTLQAQTLQSLLALDWDIVAPGHGHPRDYRQFGDDASTRRKVRQREMEQAIVDLHR